MNYSGKITLIIGSMYSGKTSEMIRLINRAKIIGNRILCIKYYKDNRFTSDNYILSRDKNTTENVDTIISKGNSIKDTIENINISELYDMICIDEVQFYTDGAEMCDYIANIGLEVICSGLQGTYERKPFETISKLISLSENIIQLKALDTKSKTECSFTKRLGNETDLELIGNIDKYIACNRKNYFSN